MGLKLLENFHGVRTLAGCRDTCYRAILASTRWLAMRNTVEFEGDDSVGWWFLLHCGKRIPLDHRERLDAQLRAILPGLQVGRDTLYTATAVARTLMRAGYLPDHRAVARAFTKALMQSDDIKRLTPMTQCGKLPRDVIWLLQSMYELYDTDDTQVCAAISHVIRHIVWDDPLRTAMIWPIFKSFCTPHEVAGKVYLFRSSKHAIVSVPYLSTHLDWEVSYILLACTDLDLVSEANRVAEYLVSKQSESQWDEATDENIESTSLVSIALAVYWRFRYLRRSSDMLVPLVDGVLSRLLGSDIDSEESLEDRWLNLRDANRETKGRAFEQFVAFYANKDNCLKVESIDKRTRSEEIDLILKNLSGSDFYKRLDTHLILMECKFTIQKTSARQVRDFEGKVRNRKRMFCKVGVIASLTGFTEDAREEMFRMSAREESIIIAGVTGEEIERAVMSGRSLSSLIENALISLTQE